ncbi:MAG: type II secretion system F family protein [Mycobacteriales bacterium]
MVDGTAVDPGRRSVRVLAGLAGALGVAGILLAIAGLFGTRADRPAAPSPVRARLHRLVHAEDTGSDRIRIRRARQLVTALGAAGLVWLVTGWPVAALAAAVAAPGMGWLFRPKTGAGRIERLEALEQWTRRLSDLLVVGSGIEQALVVSVRTAPAPIAPQVAALAARLQARTATEAALRAFADEVDDPAGDLVAAALILASRRRGRGLAQVLDGLARAVADEVVVRRGIDADRAKPRTTARAVTWITLLAAAALILLDRAYVAPFGTGVGQLVLAGVLALFAGSFVWMQALANVGAEHRFLVEHSPRLPSGGRAAGAGIRLGSPR